jgi:hypothetical protein
MVLFSKVCWSSLIRLDPLQVLARFSLLSALKDTMLCGVGVILSCLRNNNATFECGAENETENNV